MKGELVKDGEEGKHISSHASTQDYPILAHIFSGHLPSICPAVVPPPIYKCASDLCYTLAGSSLCLCKILRFSGWLDRPNPGSTLGRGRILDPIAESERSNPFREVAYPLAFSIIRYFTRSSIVPFFLYLAVERLRFFRMEAQESLEAIYYS
ncbi:hypothetical protein SLEP1_g59210 [Rubroshorea leprosula]|uniref:Uncharacterized protein n=1 Tax=Rubroshorea leprosula TaxID=152421 RepID=A0AAV5MW73_9ROSI|nr:hypothetical protein SLEP1_g59210 [Rubroshorea leprosula]